MKELVNNTLKEIEQNIKKYLTNIIYNLLGLEIDTWGHLNKINKELKDYILETDEYKNLQEQFHKQILNTIITKFDNDYLVHNKSLSDKLILKLKNELEADIVSNLYQSIKNDLIESRKEQYIKIVDEELRNNDYIKELMLRKL
ncbi:MAG: hypothetical protein ACOC2W_04090 [bacterium]